MNTPPMDPHWIPEAMSQKLLAWGSVRKWRETIVRVETALAEQVGEE